MGVKTGPAVRDAALWAVLSAAAVLDYRDHPRSSVALGLVLPLLVLAAAVAGGRRWPGAAVVVANGLCALGLTGSVTPGNGYLPALAVSAYLLGARSDRTGRALLVFGGCLAADLLLCAALRADPVWWFYTLAMLPTAMVLPWLAGRYWHARQALVRGGWDRARVLEQQQRLVADRAKFRERTRIAADMHDSLGHVLSLVALRAGALELSPTLSGQDRADLAELRAAVSDAVEELRETIGVLRGDADGDPAVAPRESVDDLVARVRTSGVAVDMHREDAPPRLPPLVDRAVYRVVQEALTNAVKHAPGSAVRIAFGRARRGTEVTVRVTNSAPPEGGPAKAVTGNRGLAGLRERVSLVGGTLRAEPCGDGGFEVVAVLPVRVSTGRPPTAGETVAAAAGTQPASHGGDAPESARGLAAARRRARLRFASAFAVPAGAGLVLLGSAALLAHQLASCVLRPADYAALRTGEERARFADVLPERPYPYPSDAMRAWPAPPGAACDFYRSNGSLLGEADVYRLCYSGSRLVAKDVLPAEPERG
ncbi:sensor histidine kinase [Streptomyces paromomycinus]|uniref:histidine kinase n=1 Tax=Streptomyces paromomycinus TaxID=92743 RepID=A0A401WF59_STREY|nr:sensor histidine kinase [Streptomyces paromomycinus]GCD47942.1 two-component sensor histidine kinase [Streptomyces paromomycinus]